MSIKEGKNQKGVVKEVRTEKPSIVYRRQTNINREGYII